MTSAPEIHTTHVFTETEFQELLGELKRRAFMGDDILSLVAFDTETTGLNEYAPWARISMIQLTCVLVDGPTGVPLLPTLINYVVPLSHPDSTFKGQWRARLRELAHTLATGHRLIAHNGKFDCRWIAACAQVNLTPAVFWDTALGATLLNENITAGLKATASRTFGIPRWDDVDFSEPRWAVPDKNGNRISEKVPYFQLADYGTRDTFWTLRLALWQWDRFGITPAARQDLLEEATAEAVQQLRLGRYALAVGMPGVRALTEMEITGFRLDDDECEREQQAAVSRGAEATQQLATITREALEDQDANELLSRADAGWEASSGWFDTWADQMIEAKRLRVSRITPGGKVSWAKDALKDNIRQGFRAAEHVLTVRQAARSRSYIDTWRDWAGEDERIHATYHFYRVITGRLSCTDPNMQQVTRTLKGCFAAGPGRILVTADFSQIELRIAAHLSGCPDMIAAYHDDRDLHRELASLIAGVTPEGVTKEQRQNAKAGNFGFLFGMQASSFINYALANYDVSVTLEEAEAIYRAFFTRWSGLRPWHQAVEKMVRKQGFVTSPLGRVRRLPEVWGDEYTASKAVRQAYNSPVQSMANDLMMLATDKIRREHSGVLPVALIHDSVVCEAPMSMGAAAGRAVKMAMENLDTELRHLGVSFKVPLKADVVIGPRWGDGTTVELS